MKKGIDEDLRGRRFAIRRNARPKIARRRFADERHEKMRDEELRYEEMRDEGLSWNRENANGTYKHHK